MPLTATNNLIYSSCLTATKEGKFIRVVYSPSAREAGWEKEGAESTESVAERSARYDADSNERFQESISRTKSLVRQYARCNDWKYFFTFTLSPEKWDRFNLKDFYRSFSKMVNNLNYRRFDGNKLKYVIIPEQHKNGAWHMHGIMNGLPEGELIENEHGYLDWPRYSEKYGYCSISVIRDMDACSLYITKYVTKEMFKTTFEKGSHVVMASHGLNKAEKLFCERGKTADAFVDSVNWDWVSKDGIKIKTVKEGDNDYGLFVHWTD